METAASEVNKSQFVAKENPETPWTYDYHNYTTTWDSNGFTYHVDNEIIGFVSSKSPSFFAADNNVKTNGPFDEEVCDYKLVVYL